MPDILNAGYCLERMDGEEGLDPEVTPIGGLTVDEQTSFLRITDLPIDPSSSDIPGVELRFRQPIKVTAVVLSSRSPATSAPTGLPAATTTTSRTAAGERQVEVTLTLLTKKPGDDEFTPLIDDNTNQPRVMTAIHDTCPWPVSLIWFLTTLSIQVTFGFSSAH